ncbi:MAG: molybdate ABC transporter substrate-binding protein [Hydrogenophaga sp.]|nr:molybdate ABC transporter substrate-binding protein [Hydrogenophaga sp.]
MRPILALRSAPGTAHAQRSAGWPNNRLSGWLVALLLMLGAPLAWAQPVVVAASDLKFALEEVSAQFRRDGGAPVRLVFGSSGNFYRQIQQGAPFHLFLSADEDFVFKLADAGKTLDRGHRYAVGRIGLMVPKGSPLKADGELRDLALALKDGRLQKFAIANPEHAPYGTRAMEALQHAGLWQQIQPRLVLGENISQAAQFATSGSTQGGIVAYSLALAPAVAAQGSFALIPEAWHQPLNQRMVLLQGADATARAFYAYLKAPAAQAVLRRYGFSLPDSPAGRTP